MKYLCNQIISFCFFVLILILIPINVFNLYIFVHYLIILLSCISLFKYKEMPFSLFKVFHIFSLFFMGIAPILQYNENIRFVGESIISENIKLNVSILVLFCNVLFNFIYSILYKKQASKLFMYFYKRTSSIDLGKIRFSPTVNLVILVVAFYCFYMIFKVNNFNFFSLLLRGSEFNTFSEGNKAIDLLTDKFFRPLSLVLFLISALNNKKNSFLNFLLFIIFLFTNFPSGISRNALAGFYLPIILLFLPIFRKKNYFVLSIMLGLLTVFPFMHSFRYGRFQNSGFGFNFQMFTEMHFDAYMTLVRVVNYDLITYGNQLLGVIFFFVPRSIWINKPLSSGQFHAQQLRLDFENLSCTFLAEGYLNFGYLGVFLFLIFLAYFSSNLDSLYLKFKSKNTFYNVIYVYFIGMFLFILRGDLMNSYAYTFGLIFTSILAYKFLTFLSKTKYN
jgi:hypothetical protein